MPSDCIRLPQGSNTSLVLAHGLQARAVDDTGADIGSDDEVAAGHDGRLRVVLSDVTSRFPTEHLPQQVPDDVTSKPKEAANAFQVQRRGGQGRVCRGLMAAASDAASETAPQTAPQAGSSLPAEASSQAAAMGRSALRSSARLQAEASTAPDAQPTESATSDGQTGICTRRQAKLNKRPSQQSPPQQMRQSHQEVSSDDDFAVLGRSQRQGRAAYPPPSHSTATLEPSHSEDTSGYAQTSVAEKPSAVRRNRPRLQLNRKPKGVGDMVAPSQASASSGSQLAVSS